MKKEIKTKEKIIREVVESYFEETEAISKWAAYDIAERIFQACLAVNGIIRVDNSKKENSESLKVNVELPIAKNQKLNSLIKKYGKSKVKKILGNMLQYEVIKSIGNVYEETIELADFELDELEELLT